MAGSDRRSACCQISDSKSGASRSASLHGSQLLHAGIGWRPVGSEMAQQDHWVPRGWTVPDLVDTRL